MDIPETPSTMSTVLIQCFPLAFHHSCVYSPHAWWWWSVEEEGNSHLPIFGPLDGAGQIWKQVLYNVQFIVRFVDCLGLLLHKGKSALVPIQKIWHYFILQARRHSSLATGFRPFATCAYPSDHTPPHGLGMSENTELHGLMYLRDPACQAACMPPSKLAKASLSTEQTPLDKLIRVLLVLLFSLER